MTTLTREQLRALLIEVGLAHRADEIMAAVRPGINVDRQRVQDEAEIPIGASKLGGNPDLPPGLVWSIFEGYPLTFVAQFNLAEVKPYDVEGLLPSSGMLYFFCDTEGEYWGATDRETPGSVHYTSQQVLQLTRTKRALSGGQDELPHLLPACTIEFKTMITLPDEVDKSHLGLSWSPKNMPDAERYSLWMDKVRNIAFRVRTSPDHRLFGTPHDIQHSNRISAVEANANIVYRSETETEVMRLAKDWRLLLQLDSDYRSNQGLGVMWGDAGLAYWLIRSDDLSAHRFENAWWTLESH